MKSLALARRVVQVCTGHRALLRRRITLPFYCGVLGLLGAAAFGAAPTLTPPAVSNVGANQVTLVLGSSAAGTGYFTLLPGAGAPPGTGAQVQAGRDSAGATAFRFGSLPLAPTVAGYYTLRNLTANTTYTVCFTADDGATVQPTAVTTSFTTAAAANLAGADWAAVGGEDFTVGGASELSLAFSPQGAPFLAYRDNASGGRATVLTHNGSAWVGVGAAGFSPDIPNDLTLVFAPDGRPYVVFANFGGQNKAMVMRFDGSAWTTVGGADFTPAQVGEMSLAFAPNGDPWIAFRESNNGFKATVMRFGGISWSVVGTAGFSLGTVGDVKLVFAPDGTPHVAFRDDARSSRATVMKFDGTDWAVVGTAGFSPGGAYFLSPGFAPDGTLHVAYSDYANAAKATVMAFTAGAWNAVGGQDFSASEAKYLSLGFAPGGRPWVSFRDLVGGQHRATVMAFDDSAWTLVGTRGFSNDGVADVPMGFSPDGVPFVAFSDNPTGKATVVKLAPPPPSPTVASVGVPAAGAYAAGNPLNFVVNFDAAVTVTGAPRLPLTFGSTTRYATYVSGSGTAAIVFRYTLQAGDAGVLAVGGAIELNGGTIAGTAGGAVASLTLSGVGPTAGVIIGSAPTLSTPTFSNVGANQVTLALRSSATGTGYFTLLAGGATPGSGTQTKAGRDSTGAAAARFGSLALTANTTAVCTVRNLAANTTYTLCFTADDGAALQPTAITASFTTTTAMDATGRSWTVVGSRAFSGSTIYSALAFAADGTPFVAYKDMPWERKATVMKFAAGAWEPVGTRGISTVPADYPSLGFAPDGSLFLAYMNNDTVAGGQSTVMKFDTAWSVVGGAGFSAGRAAYASVAFLPDGAPLVAFADSGRTYKATVMKFNGTAWTALGTPGFSAGAAHWTSLAIGPNGVPMLAYSDDSLGRKATVMKFDGSAWIVVGTAGFSTGEVVTPSLAFAPDGTPYLGYTDFGPSYKATVKKFDGSAWVTVGAVGFSGGQANYTSLAIAPDGVPWIAYGDAAHNYRATVMKFDGSAWSAVGAAGFTPGEVAYTSLEFAPDGTPFVVFQDVPLGDRMTVMKLAAVVPTTPTIAWSAPAAITYGTPLTATQLNATASAGGQSVPGTFVYTPAAGTVLDAGSGLTLSVTFTPTDSALYTTANATTTITVNRAPATVALSGLAATYDGSPHPVAVTTTPASLPVAVTYDGGAAAPTNAGSYAVTATIPAGSNYTGAASGTLVIARAGQTISFAALPAKNVGDASFALGAAASSGLAVNYTSSNPGVATVSGSIVTLVAAGTTTLTASQPGDANYHAAVDVTQTLAVNATTPPLVPPTLVSPPVPAVPAPPAIVSTPASQHAVENETIAFRVVATGQWLSFQWQKDGVDIPGARSSSLLLRTITLADTGVYAVRVWNDGGSTSAVVATLTVTPRANAPAIVTQPEPSTVEFGGTAVFSVTASGAAPLTYQWLKDDMPIHGATGATLTLASVQPSAAGSYQVVVSNSAGRATSGVAPLSVADRELAGAYFGTFGAAPNGGTFALFLRANGTGVFLGYDCARKTAFVDCNVRLDAARGFHVEVNPAHGPASAGSDEDRELVVHGAILPDGAVAGRVAGRIDASLEAPAPSVSRVCASLAGFYRAGASGDSAISYTIVGATGQSYVLTIQGASADAGNGTVSTDGAVNVTTENNAAITGQIDSSSATIGIRSTPASGPASWFRGANNDARSDSERLANISTRSQTGAGNVLIAGFALAGEESTPVLIRAVGPTLGASFNVANTLAAARLEVFKGATSVAAGNDWGRGGDPAGIARMAAALGAFPLPSGSRDAALLLTLEPGSYSVVVTGQGGATGVALVEVYAAASGTNPPGERLINLSTRGIAGSGDDMLIAGFVITGSVPKRVLVRGVGPSLAQFPGVGNVLARPQIAVMWGNSVVARNTGWSTSADARAIAAAAAQVGAFAFAPDSQDAALLVNLPPGAYTAQVTGAGGTGTALVEIYEIP